MKSSIMPVARSFAESKPKPQQVAHSQADVEIVAIKSSDTKTEIAGRNSNLRHQRYSWLRRSPSADVCCNRSGPFDDWFNAGHSRFSW
jgi:hypothetical protein